MEKLQNIQNELKSPKNQYNKFGKYNYRSCEDILEAVKPILKKHKCTLTISDSIKQVGNYVFVEAVATISDGEKKESVYAQAGISDRKGMDIAQSFGSSSSYARKYALNGLFLIDDTKDSDATNTHGKETNQYDQKVKKQIKEAESLAELTAIFNANGKLHTNTEFMNDMSNRKNQLK